MFLLIIYLISYFMYFRAIVLDWVKATMTTTSHSELHLQLSPTVSLSQSDQSLSDGSRYVSDQSLSDGSRHVSDLLIQNLNTNHIMRYHLNSGEMHFTNIKTINNHQEELLYYFLKDKSFYCINLHTNEIFFKGPQKSDKMTLIYQGDMKNNFCVNSIGHLIFLKYEIIINELFPISNNRILFLLDLKPNGDLVQIKLRGVRMFEEISDNICIDMNTNDVYITVVLSWPTDREIYVVIPLYSD